MNENTIKYAFCVDKISPTPSLLVILASPKVETYFDVGLFYFNIDINLEKSHKRLDFLENDTVFPTSIFKKKLLNGEIVYRDWLVLCATTKAQFCLSCIIYIRLQRPALASLNAYSIQYSKIK